jgi:hypothetical protein
MKVVEEYTFAYIDAALGLPLTDRQRDQRKEHMYALLTLYAQRNEYCHAPLMSVTLDNHALVTFDILLSDAERAVDFTPAERGQSVLR